MKKLLLGAHTSASGGVHNALYEGQQIGATTIQFFTSNQRQWKGKVHSKEEIELWEKARAETGIETVMSHDSYLINLGAPVEENLIKSRKAFREEIERCHALKVDFMNFHPGAHLKEPKQQCLDLIVESLLELQPLVEQGETLLLLETTAGQGSTVGRSFDEIGYIVKQVSPKMPVGVCIDTCHIFVAGYDIRTAEAWNATLAEFEQEIGLSYLKAFHLNDSLKGLGSRVDRHRPLGEGEIGLPCFEFLMQDPRTKDLPKYLETPGGPDLWVNEIQLLKDLAK